MTDGAKTNGRFDLARLFRSIDSERQCRGLSWAALGREVGVSASTIRRFGEADDAEADGVLRLMGWLQVVPEDYVQTGSVERAPLPAPGPGQVRVNMNLVAQAANDPRGADGRTRTTIQRLVEVATGADRTLASLTRLSDA